MRQIVTKLPASRNGFLPAREVWEAREVVNVGVHVHLALHFEGMSGVGVFKRAAVFGYYALTGDMTIEGQLQSWLPTMAGS